MAVIDVSTRFRKPFRPYENQIPWPTLFLHYWGKGKAPVLARAVKAALDTQAK